MGNKPQKISKIINFISEISLRIGNSELRIWIQ
jgi:hypothetical protein